jgi:hypothetical protein
MALLEAPEPQFSLLVTGKVSLICKASSKNQLFEDEIM